MADYDLGTAHGRIKIDYDGRGASEAVSDFKDVDSEAESLIERFRRLSDALDNVRVEFGDMAARAARSFGVLAGGSAILLGLSRATGRLSGSLFRLRGGVGILNALSIGFGGIPDSMKGYPKIIKQLIRLSAAITLFAASSKLLDKVGSRIARLIGQTEGFKRLSAVFPELTDRIKRLGDAAPSISDVGDRMNRLGRPIHTIVRLVFALHNLRRAIRFVVKLAGAIGAFAAAFGALAGAIVLVGGLVDALEQLSGLLGFLPGIVAGAVAAISSFKVGMQGFSEAMKNMDDLAAFNEALKNLSPAAQETARTIRGLRDEWTKLRKAVQEKLFAGMAPVIEKLANTYFPIMRQGMGSINEQFNLMAKSTAAWLQEAQNVEAVGEGFGRVAAIMRNLRAAIQPLLDAFRDLAIVGLRVMEDMSKGAGSAAQNFADFVAQARRTGDLRTWMEQGVQGIKDLTASIINLGSVFDTIFDAFDQNNKGFLAGLRSMTESWDRFLKSVEGQQVLNNLATTMLALGRVVKDVLVTYLKELGPVFEALLPLIVSLAQAFGTTLTTAIKILAPVLQVVADALGAMAPILGPIAGLLLGVAVASKSVSTTFKILKGIAGMLLSGLSTLLDVLGFAKTAFFAVGRGAGKAVMGLGRLAAAFGRAVVAAGKYVIAMGRVAAANIAAGIGRAVGALGRLGSAFIAAGGRAAAASRRVIAAFVAMAAAAVRNTAKVVAQMAIQMAKWTALAARAMAKAAVIAAAWLIANPFVAIAAAVAAIVALIILNWDKISAFLLQCWNWIKNTAITVWNAIKNFFVGFFTWLWGLWVERLNAIKVKWTQIWNSVKNFFVMIWNSIKTIAITVWNAIKNFFLTIWNGIKTVAITVWNAIKNFFVMLWNSIKNIAMTVFNALKNFFTMIWNGIKNVTRTVWNAVKNFLVGLWNGIKNIAKTVFNAIKNFFVMIWNAVKNFFVTIWNSIKNFLVNTWNGIRNTVRTVFTAIKNFFVNIWNSIVNFVRNAATNIWNAIKNGVSRAYDAVVEWLGKALAWIKSLPGKIKNVFANFSNLLYSAGRDLLKGLWNGIKSAFSWVMDKIKGVASSIANGFKSMLGIGSPSRVFAEFGKNLMEGLAQGIEENKYKVARSVKRAAYEVRTTAQRTNSYIAPRLYDAGQRMMTSLRNGINSVVDRIRAELPRIMDFIRSKIPQIRSALNEFLGRRSGATLRATVTPDVRGGSLPPYVSDRRAPLVYRPDAEPNRMQGPQSIIGELNMPLQETTDTDELVRRLLYETKRVGKGLYQR